MTSSEYQIISKLGTGSFSQVHKATRKTITVALKQVPLTDKPALKQLDNEAHILKVLPPHNNLICLIAEFSTDTYKNLVLEFVQGGDLFYCLNSDSWDSITSKTRRLIFYQIVIAVNHLHKNNVVHRDLKIENILLTTDVKTIQTKLDEEQTLNLSIPDYKPVVKLCDFGLSKEIINHTLVKQGSEEYLAPELIIHQSKSMDIDLRKVDCWALGVILYCILTRELPFIGVNKRKMFGKIARGEYSIPDGLNVDLDAVDLLEKILNTNPGERFDCDQILNHQWFK